MHMKRVDPSSEHGVAMLVVLMALVAGSMLGVVALSAAGADLPFAKASQDRKQAYAAAEAGMAYYMYQLSLDNDYWTRCDQVPPPSTTEPSPVNQMWDGVGTDPRRWRTLSGTKSEYTIELIPEAGSTCTPGTADSTMIDRSSGTFRVRVSGRSDGITRTLVNTLRRRAFLDYIYFTDYETADPITYANATDRANAEAQCVKPRDDRASWCTEIQFSSTDAIKGPFHTNDSVLHCGSTQFGRRPDDRIEVSDPGGFKNVGGSGCAGPPDTLGTFVPEAEPLEVPPSNAALQAEALPAYTYTGKTTILLKGNVMDVTTGSGPKQTNVPLPANGVIYVNNSSCSSGTTIPQLARYNESAGCGNLYISGTYSKSLTIATANDIIVGGPGVSNGSLLRDTNQDVVLGLIATNFVRVYHPVTRSDWSDPNNCTNAAGTNDNVRIDAAILTLKHSFTVDNYRCGAKLETLKVMGAIAQKFRGPVGTTRPTGYTKDYEYDDRLKYRSPPFFLDPVSASWNINRANEQVPAVAERN